MNASSETVGSCKRQIQRHKSALCARVHPPLKAGMGVRAAGEADFLCDVGPKYQVSLGQMTAGPTDQGLVNTKFQFSIMHLCKAFKASLSWKPGHITFFPF